MYDGNTYRLVTYSHPKTDSLQNAKEIRHFGDIDASMERLIMTIPNVVQGVAPHSQAVDQVMVKAVNSKRMVAFMVDTESEPTPAYRALAHSFNQYVVFGYLSTSDKEIMKRFQVTKTPALVVMFEQEDPNEKKEKKQEYIDKKVVEEERNKNVQFGMAQFNTETMGDIQYGNVGAWLQQVLGQVRPEGLPNEDGSTNSYGSSSSSSKKEVEHGPLKEIENGDMFDALCPMKNKLCAILIMDGGTTKEEQKMNVDAVELARLKESSRLSWSWLDGICHSKMASLLLGDSVDLSSTLPTMVIVSRSKARRVLLAGGDVQDATAVTNFASEVKKGDRKSVV